MRDAILTELRNRNAHICDAAQAAALGKLLVRQGVTVNAECVGQDPRKIAQMAGFSVADLTTALIAELGGIGREHPLSAEKLSPVLSLYFVDSFDKAVDACEAILRFGGLGHTCGIHTEDEAKAREYGRRMPAFRVLVNTPTPQGSTGITTNLFPAMTLGCGAIAGNATGDNVTPLHLINTKRVAWLVRKPEEAFPPRPAELEAPTQVSMPSTIEKAMVVTAVEKYLAARGLSENPSTESATGSSVAAVVDRFLAARGLPSTSASSSSSASTGGDCGCALPVSAPQAMEPKSAPIAPAPTPPTAPKLELADFVCENDIRQAINQSKKIYVGKKTIVTPSARDLGIQYDVLVVAER